MVHETKTISTYLASGYVLIQVNTWEEDRALEAVRAAAGEVGKAVTVWRHSSGFGDNDGPGPADAAEALSRISRSDQPGVFVMLDFHPFWDRPEVVRRLRDLCTLMESRGQAMVMIDPVSGAPVELEKEFAIVDLAPPDEAELMGILEEVIAEAVHAGELADDRALREAVVRAALGLTAREARRIFRRVLHTRPDFGRDDEREVLDEKRMVLRRSDLLEFYDAIESLRDVGGLDLLKDWLMNRAEAFGERAREYGLPPPKGLLLLGVQGCGKSLSAKAVSGLWGIPLIRLDLAAIMDREGGGDNMRRSLATAESLSPCVLWIDEIEKGFSTHRVAGSQEHGRMARAFATFLVWLQEKRSPVYVIATANSIEEMPPELLRKGRFDDIFFVDLPQVKDREDIFRVHLEKRKRKPEAFDLPGLATASEGLSGSEIEQVVISAMYEAFTQKREVNTKDIMKEIENTVPLSETMEEKINALRDWARTRARPASLDTKLMDLLHGEKES